MMLSVVYAAFAGTRRVGHAGTRSMATGVLVVCLGQTTRLVEYVVGPAENIM